jgi:hypothetical protein
MNADHQVNPVEFISQTIFEESFIQAIFNKIL